MTKITYRELNKNRFLKTQRTKITLLSLLQKVFVFSRMKRIIWMFTYHFLCVRQTDIIEILVNRSISRSIHGRSFDRSLPSFSLAVFQRQI